MKNAMQLKAIINKIAKEKNISPQTALQNFLLERFLERISKSKYNKNFIIKGGFLIASIVGLDSRTTMDMDTTLKGLPLNAQQINKIISDVVAIDLDDNIAFELYSIEEIRERDEYEGFRVSLYANCPPIKAPLKIDITTGDVITPREIEFKYKTMLDNKTISVLAYNTSTVVAEKLETIISRGINNTRMRDYYDVYILFTTRELNIREIKIALERTATKRDTKETISNYKEILTEIQNNQELESNWKTYSLKNKYVKAIAFSGVIGAIKKLLDLVMGVN